MEGKMKVKYRIFLLPFILASLAVASCTDDFVYEKSSPALQFDESDIIDATLKVKVNDFIVDASTRDEEPTEDAVEIVSDFEKKVDRVH